MYKVCRGGEFRSDQYYCLAPGYKLKLWKDSQVFATGAGGEDENRVGGKTIEHLPPLIDTAVTFITSWSITLAVRHVSASYRYSAHNTQLLS